MNISIDLSSSAWFFVVLASCASASATPVLVTNNPLYHPSGTGDVIVNRDLNQDGINDVEISHYPVIDAGVQTSYSIDYVKCLNGASVVMNGKGIASKAIGTSVGPADTFGSPGAFTTIVYSYRPYDDFPSLFGDQNFAVANIPEHTSYAVGVKIPVNDQDYFAYLGFSTINNGAGGFAGRTTNGFIMDYYGYETAPNTAVTVVLPEPASLSLSLLALAAAPLLARRRR